MRTTRPMAVCAALGSAVALAIGCQGTAVRPALPPVHAPPGPTWRLRCAALMEQTRMDLQTTNPALAAGHVQITRDPETSVRLDARTPDGGYYEVRISEPSPNSDFDSDIHEEPWRDVRNLLRPIRAPLLALECLHQDRRAWIAADKVKPELADQLARRMQPVADECLRLAERVVSRDHYFIATITGVTAWSGGAAQGVFLVDDAPRELVTMHVEEVEKDVPFAKDTTQRFAVASAAAFRDLPPTQRRSYWLRTDTEDGKTTFALARTISMIDENDRCPDVPLAGPDAGPDAGLDEDGCP